VPRPLTMPRLSDSMEEAVILRWLKEPGEAFVRGEPIAEIETDKATVVYEAETDGVISAIVVAEGDPARIGEPIATLEGGDGDSPVQPAGQPTAGAAAPTTPTREDVPRPHDGSGRTRATPVARRRADELGVSLDGLSGTGPDGRITRTDVERAAETAAEPTDAGEKGTIESIALTPTQSTIARRMTLSASTIPTFTITLELDMSSIRALRREARAAGSSVPSVNDYVVRATALTLRDFPRFNSSYVDGRIEQYSRVNIGIAVAVDGALLVPTVFDADGKSIDEIAAESRSLVARAKSRELSLSELTQSTFTVSNLGMYGVHSFTAIVDPSQTAILAVGAVARRPVEGDDGSVAFADRALVTLSADHRVVYGADAAAFLARLKTFLEQPDTLAA